MSPTPGDRLRELFENEAGIEMSYGLMVYSADIDMVRVACGSGDQALRLAISDRFRTQIAALNDDLGYANREDEPSVGLALRHLIDGEEQTLRDGALYAYAFKLVVEQLGTVLDNALFYPARTEHLTDTVGPALEATGARVRMWDLLTNRSPVPFRHPDDFPMYGYWDEQSVAQSVAPLETALEAANGARRELAAIHGWLTHAAEQRQGVVSFYY